MPTPTGLRLIVVSVVLILLSLSSSAQELTGLRNLGSSLIGTLVTSPPDSKGNFYMYTTVAQSSDSVEILGKRYAGNETHNFLKFDSNGNLLWMKILPLDPFAIAYDGSDNLVITGTIWGPSGFNSFAIAKFTPDLQTLWFVKPQVRGLGMDVAVDHAGYTYVTGRVQEGILFGTPITVGQSLSDHVFLAKLDPNGNHVWVNVSSFNRNSYGRRVYVSPNGTIIMSGTYKDELLLGSHGLPPTNGNVQAFFACVEPEGKVRWVKGLSSSGNSAVRDIEVDLDNSIYFTGAFDKDASIGDFTVSGPSNNSFVLGKLDENGTAQWLKSAGESDIAVGSSLVLSPFNDQIYVTGYAQGAFNPDHATLDPDKLKLTAFVARYAKGTGKADWVRRFGGVFSPEGRGLFNPDWFTLSDPAVIPVSAQKLNVAGIFSVNIAGSDGQLTTQSLEDVFMGHINDTTRLDPRVILKGHVYQANDGCDESQKGIPGIVVKAEPGPYFGITDQNGDYQLHLPTGEYTVTQVPKHTNTYAITPTCNAYGQFVSIPTLKTIPPAINFGNKVVTAPWMNVDVAMSPMRACLQSNMVFSYSNTGSKDAHDVEVTITLPPYVNAKTSTIPWTEKTGSKLVYKIPLVPVGTFQAVTIGVEVACGPEFGQLIASCVTVSITPKNVALPDPSWDHSDLGLRAQCIENKLVRLSLTNKGSDMANPSSYKIYSGDDLVYDEMVKLASNETLDLQVAAGSTVSASARNTPGAPNPFVTAVVDYCPLAPTGFTTVFPIPDDEPETETYCTPIVYSRDPNDKTVAPIGITSNHNIVGDEALEYLIRFQNIGTAPAINVFVEDELDESLDLSTLEIGLSSHPVSFAFGQDTGSKLTWTFNNIMLPDSTSDEPNSHGFVKYKIKPKQGLAKGTVIRNKASIIFDFNSPVITNEVFHTIGLPPPDSTAIVQECNKEVVVDAGPNESITLCDDNAVKLAPVGKDLISIWDFEKGHGTPESQGEFTVINALTDDLTIVKQKVVYCDESDERKLTINRYFTPSPIGAQEIDRCTADVINEPILVKGGNVTWYYDKQLTQVAATGNSFIPKNSSVVYVTDKNVSCESTPSPITIVVNALEKAAIENVITPNGDNINELFYLPDPNLETCLGKFRQVHIYDRNGSTLFESDQFDFTWDGGQAPPGVYFYTIAFDYQRLNGTLSIIR